MYRCLPPRSAPTCRDGAGPSRRLALALLTTALLTTTACTGGPAADRAASLGHPPPADSEGASTGTDSGTGTAGPDPAPDPAPTDEAPSSPACAEREAPAEVVDVTMDGTYQVDAGAALALLPGGDAVVGSRTGTVHRVDPGAGAAETVTRWELPNVNAEARGGLLGLEADAGHLYAYYTVSSSAQIGRFSYGDDGDVLGGFSSMLRPLPMTDGSIGGHLAVGPDGMFYAALGADGLTDGEELAGRLVRISASGFGGPALDPDTLVYAPGSPWIEGFAWDHCERLWVVDAAGELSTLGTPDEGPHPETLLGEWGEDVSPTGLAYLDGALWMSDASGERLWRVPLKGKRMATDAPQQIPVPGNGPLRSLRAGSDGRLYALDDSGLVVLSVG